MNRLIKVLIVDDSAYVRKVVKEMLSRSPFIDVIGGARDGVEALELVLQLKPDVVTCDLNMPNMDGVTFVREQMARSPLPIVILSITNEAGEDALNALDAGAVDFVQKPTALATERILEVSGELIDKVKSAALIPLKLLHDPSSPIARSTIKAEQTSLTNAVDIIVIGISTGGPQALKSLISELPEDFPLPVAVVLHMPEGYTQMYARKLDETCSLNVVEARAGDIVKPGIVFIAPAGRHLSFRRSEAGTVTVRLDARPFDLPHRPAADVLFQSAAEIYHERVLGIVMTGMGSDGKQGAAWIKSQGGIVFTQSEDTCVVYGMPGSVVAAGLSDKVVPLQGMARAMEEVSGWQGFLVVDDSGLSRRTLRRILEADGHQVTEAEDGAHALEQYFLEPPDIVMLDLVMKGLYGIDVLVKLRELDRDARVIVASADIQSSTHSMVKDAGALAFITKPFVADEVLAIVRRVLPVVSHGTN